MAAKPKNPSGPAMTLGNMRQLGVQRLLAHWRPEVFVIPHWRQVQIRLGVYSLTPEVRFWG